VCCFYYDKKIIYLLFCRPSDVRYRDACAIVLRPANFTYDSATHAVTDGFHTVSELFSLFFIFLKNLIIISGSFMILLLYNLFQTLSSHTNCYGIDLGQTDNVRYELICYTYTWTRFLLHIT